MTYGEWISVETRRECERETIAKKLKRGCTPTWIHEEDKFPMELIREVQADRGLMLSTTKMLVKDLKRYTI